MTFYPVSLKELIGFTIAVVLLNATIVISYMESVKYFEAPIVEMKDGQCAKVVNFKNNDAFVCSDVGVVLRRYRVKNQ